MVLHSLDAFLSVVSIVVWLGQCQTKNRGTAFIKGFDDCFDDLLDVGAQSSTCCLDHHKTVLNTDYGHAATRQRPYNYQQNNRIYKINLH